MRGMTPEHDLNETPLLARKGCWLTFVSVIPLLIGLFWVVEDSAGKRYLAKTEARLAEAGFSLDPATALPDAPPDEENFCAIPIMRQVGRGAETGPEIEAINKLLNWVGYLSYSGTKLPSPNAPQAVDWEALYREIAQRDPSANLPENPENAALALAQAVEAIGGPVFAEMEAALDRPQAAFLPTMKEVFQSPNWRNDSYFFKPYNDLQKVLYFRTNLSLANGRADQALTTLRLQWKLSEAAHNYNSITGGLLGITASETAKYGLWKGLWNRHFQKAELHQLITLLGSLHTLEKLPRTFQAEFISQHKTWAMLRQATSKASLFQGPAGSTAAVSSRLDALLGLLPKGWFDFNLGRAFHYQLAWLSHIEDTTIPNRFDYENWQGERPLTRGVLWHDYAAKEWFSMGSTGKVYASDHATNQLALVACALELYFLDHQSYPESLAELAPACLPEIPLDFDQKPIRYQKEEVNGRYKLWSIGLNGTDEGGIEIAGPHGKKPRLWREATGDWLWQYPPTATP